MSLYFHIFVSFTFVSFIRFHFSVFSFSAPSFSISFSFISIFLHFPLFLYFSSFSFFYSFSSVFHCLLFRFFHSHMSFQFSFFRFLPFEFQICIIWLILSFFYLFSFYPFYFYPFSISYLFLNRFFQFVFSHFHFFNHFSRFNPLYLSKVLSRSSTKHWRTLEFNENEVLTFLQRFLNRFVFFCSIQISSQDLKQFLRWLHAQQFKFVSKLMLQSDGRSEMRPMAAGFPAVFDTVERKFLL